MTQTAATAAIPAAVKAGQVLIIGKVKSAERRGDKWMTVIVMPAPDPYSMPATVGVGSDGRLGQPGDEVQVVARLSGKSESWKDRDTGEIRNGARVWLEAVSR